MLPSSAENCKSNAFVLCLHRKCSDISSEHRGSGKAAAALSSLYLQQWITDIMSYYWLNARQQISS